MSRFGLVSLGGLFRLALRNLARHRRNTAFGLAVVALGVAGLVVARGFVLDVFDQLGEMTIRSQLGHIQLTRPGFRDSGAGRADEFLLPDARGLAAALRDDPRVLQAMGRLNFSGVAGLDRRELAVEAEGVEPLAEARLGTYLTIIEGSGLEAADQPAVLLGEGAARHLRARPGDWVNLTASTVDGALNTLELEVAGIFRSFSKEYDARALRLPLDIAQDLLQTAGVTVLVAHLQHTKDTPEVLAAARERLRAHDVELAPWYRISDFYASTRTLYDRQFGVLQLIAVVLIAISVLASFNTSVLERMAEFGTMRALGNRPRNVLGLILIEALVLGAAGAALGVALAGAVGWGVSWVGIPMPPPPNAESGYTARILLSGPAMGGAAAIGILSAVFGALPPALRVTRMPLTVALGRGL